MMNKRMKQLIITLLLLVASIALLVISGNKVKNQDINYEAVKVTVISAESERIGTVGKSYSTYNVVVEYEGVKYDLINVQSGEIIKVLTGRWLEWSGHVYSVYYI